MVTPDPSSFLLLTDTQSGSCEMKTGLQILCMYRSCNLEHSNMTVFWRLSFPPWAPLLWIPLVFLQDLPHFKLLIDLHLSFSYNEGHKRLHGLSTQLYIHQVYWWKKAKKNNRVQLIGAFFPSKKRRHSYGTGRPLDNMREGDQWDLFLAVLPNPPLGALVACWTTTMREEGEWATMNFLLNDIRISS